MIKINTWNVSNAEFITPKLGDTPGESEFITMDVADLTVSPFTYLFLDGANVHDNTIGNSLETVSIFDDKDTGSHYVMSISDGTYKAYIEISKGSIRVQGSDSPISVNNADGIEHRYTISLKETEFVVYFDTKIVASENITLTSTEKQICVGFPEEQTGSALVQFKYIKTAQGAYKYINISDIDFELQIDTASDFSSPNLKTYNKASFTTIPEEIKPWDPVAIMCGKYENGTYDFKGLVQSVTVKLPPKQDGSEYTFYYRVKFGGDLYDSQYSRTYLTHRVKPIEPALIPEETTRPVFLKLTSSDSGYKALVPPQDNAGVILPETLVSDNWTIQLYNASDKNITVYDNLSYEQAPIAPWSIVSYTYSAENNNWSSSIIYKLQTFVLPADITNVVFDAVYNHHLPAYDCVYTKVYNSGNVADVLRGSASEIDMMYSKLYTQSANISNFTATRDEFNARWKSVFGLDYSLFKNSAEMRDTMQQLVLNLRGEMLEKTISYLITCLTGAAPEIIEYKDVEFNVLWSAEDMKALPKDETYYLYDENNPSFEVKPFVLYGGLDQASTWQINIFDPYDIKYNQELITRVLDFLKPVYTYVVINFYNFEGVPYTKRYYYGIDNYLEAEYNK